MECRQVEGLLPDYSVGLLKPRQQAAVASHLDQCPRCAQEWKTFQGVIGLVETFGALEPPPGLWNGVYNRIVAETPEPAAPAWWSHLWTRPARMFGSTVAAAALVAAAYLFTSPAGFRRLPPDQADREMVVAVREHVLASAGGIFADRAGLESLAVLASSRAPETIVIRQ